MSAKLRSRAGSLLALAFVQGLVAMAAPAASDLRRVRLHPPSDVSCATGPGILRVQGGFGPGSDEAVREYPWNPHKVLEVEFEADAIGFLLGEVPECWVRPIEINPGDPRADFEMALLARAVLRFKVAGLMRPEDLAASRLALRIGPSREPGVPLEFEFEQLCSAQMVQGELECGVPLGALDLRLTIPGYAPHYWWGREVEPASTPVPELVTLHAGGAISGWVVRKGSELSNPRVRAVPALAGSPARDLSIGGEALARQSRVEGSGFFVLTGLAPGAYDLELLAGSEVLARRAGVVVGAGRETALEEPLQAIEPIAVTLAIDPPVDPLGEAWIVRLSRESRENSTTVIPMDRRVVDLDGLTDLGPLEAGQYLAEIVRSDSTVWAERVVRVEAGDSDRIESVIVPILAVVGSVRRGGEPVQAEIRLSSREGAESARFQSNSAGEFSGVVPRRGQWRIQVTDLKGRPPVRLQVDDLVLGKGNRSPERLDIEIPNTRARGRVVDASGAAVPEARVTVWRERETGRQQMLASARANELGEFVVSGLPEGDSFIEAAGTDSSTSDVLPIHLKDAVFGPEIELVISRRTRIRGTVRLGGVPAPGAAVTAWPRSTRTLHGSRAGTDRGGEFELHLASGWADFLIVAPGQHMLLVRREVHETDEERMLFDIPTATGSVRFDVVDAERSSGRPSFVDEVFLAHGGASIAVNELFQYGTVQMDPISFRIGNASAGEYAICPARGDCDRRSLMAGGEVAWELSVRPGDPASGDEERQNASP